MRKGKCREHLLTRGLGEEDERELFGIEILVSDVNHGAEGFLPPVDGDDVQGGLAGEWAVSVGLYQQLWPREINVESQLQCCIGCEQTSDGSSLHARTCTCYKDKGTFEAGSRRDRALFATSSASIGVAPELSGCSMTLFCSASSADNDEPAVRALIARKSAATTLACAALGSTPSTAG